MPTPEERAIFSVIAYHAFFGYPVTAFEIWKWQYKPQVLLEYGDILRVLESSRWLRANGIEMTGGFVGKRSDRWGGVKRQVLERQDRYLNAMRKRKKLNRIVGYLTLLPWVDGVAVCNSLALHHTDSSSDVDVFVLTKKGKIWSTRFWSVLPLRLFRQRPGECKEDPVDVSFFVSENAYDISRFAIGEDDVYLTHWVNLLIPVYGAEAFDRFFEANPWSRSFMPRAVTIQRAHAGKIRAFRKLPLPDFNDILKRLQQNVFPEDIRSRMNSGVEIVVSDDVLKFHKNDRRKAVQEALDREVRVCINS